MNSEKRLRQHRTDARYRGLALALVACVMFIFLALGSATLYCGFQNRVLALRDAQGVMAKAAADSGLKKAAWQMNGYESGPLPSATEEALLGCPASYSYSVAQNPDGAYIVTSTGTSGTAVRTVMGRLRRSYTLWSGVVVLGNVSLNASSQMLPLTPGDSLRLRTNSTAPASVSLASSSVIDGDVAVGPGGDPDRVISLGGQSAITGYSSAAPQAVDAPAVAPPTSLPQQGSVEIKKSQVIATSRQYSSLTIDQATQVKIQGDVTIYVAGNMTLRNAAKLLVQDGSRLTLYLGGDLSIDRATIMEVNLRPEKVQIYGTPTCTQITCTSSPDIYAVIYAPAATCTLNSASRLVGVFSGQSLVLSDASTLYYPQAMDAECLFGAYTWRLERWWDQ